MKKTIILPLIILYSALSLWGSGERSVEETPALPLVITFWDADAGPHSTPYLKDVIERYHALQSDVRVIYVGIPRNLAREKINIAVAGGVLPDVRDILDRLGTEKVTQDQIAQSLPVLRQVFLSSLLQGRWVSEEEVVSRIRFLQIPLEGSSFQCFACSIQRPARSDDAGSGSFSFYAVKSAVMGLLQREFASYTSFVSCEYPGDDGQCAALIGFPPGGGIPSHIARGDAAERKADVSSLLEACVEKARRELGVELTVGLGGIHADFRGISVSFHEAAKALGNAHLVGTGKVISLADVTFRSQQSGVARDIVIADILRAVRSMDKALLHEALQRFRSSVIPGVSLLRIRMDASAIAFAMINEADSWLSDYASGTQWTERRTPGEYLDRSHEAIKDIQDIGRMAAYLEGLGTELMDAITESRSSYHAQLAHKAIAYIDMNFTRETLSLAEVAEHVGVSPSHLYTLLKKEQDTTFQTYVTKVRITRAMGLLATQNYKIYEVAEKVGYSNAQYFSYAFKKFTGKTSLQYQSESIRSKRSGDGQDET